MRTAILVVLLPVLAVSLGMGCAQGEKPETTVKTLSAKSAPLDRGPDIAKLKAGLAWVKLVNATSDYLTLHIDGVASATAPQGDVGWAQTTPGMHHLQAKGVHGEATAYAEVPEGGLTWTVHE
ncbi:MAG: hypothetical protein ACYTAF_01245 [Planctomycetota bacterium]|jgi:hypothetical protein